MTDSKRYELVLTEDFGTPNVLKLTLLASDTGEEVGHILISKALISQEMEAKVRAVLPDVAADVLRGALYNVLRGDHR